ncbi:hypothetical protein [Butyrivibrio sp. YAB3001]|uniref:hypothetical protein n=1 Tax=Butyrivibrio sp. YAB3001 TaxID=1520812 RepID=UPI0011303F91|nr:hypothetical protein [Butyrivibrio sp. YAB3001]
MPKSLYPYFSMSIYNLIPACKVCNSSFKGQIDFDYEKNINPYEEALDTNLMNFSYLPDDFTSAVGLEPKDLQVVLDYHSEKKDYARLKNNCDIFAIDTLYQNHTDVVSNILKKHYVFNDTYKEIIRTTYPGLFSSTYEVDKMLYETIEKQEVKNAILGKLKYDIKTQLDGTCP